MSIPGSASPLFFGAGAAEAAAFTLQKSVRFNDGDSAYLNRTPSSAGNTKTWTWSCWVKRSEIGSIYPGLLSAGSTSQVTGFFQITFEADEFSVFMRHSGGTNYAYTNAKLRDTSAWYHLVVAMDTTAATEADRLKMYVNGAEQTFRNSSIPAQNRTFLVNGTALHQIGATKNSGGTTNLFLPGYLADLYLIDGQQLDPTSFGAFDDNGVWQAAAYSGSFGTNGFHLFDFASESGIGNDSSGNDNDFTVNNLQADGLFVNQGFTSPGNAFDGNTGTYAEVTTSAALGQFVFPGGISVSSSVKIKYSSGTSGNVYLNGSATALAGTGAQEHNITFSGTLNTIGIQSSSKPVIYYVDIDNNGTYLTGGAAEDQDVLFDVPTNGTQSDTGAGGEVSGNYCTFNPLGSVLTYASFSNGNLDHVASNNASHFSFASGTIAFNSADTTGFYFEVTQTTYGQYSTIGLHDVAYQLTAATTGAAIGSGATNGPMGITYSNTGTVYNFGTSISSQPTYTAAGDVIGVAVKGNKIWFAKNNSWISGDPSTGTSPTATLSASKNLTPCITGYNSGEFSLNAGQRAFSYSAPTGFKALCTTNLPTPTIANGRNYFDIKLWTGNGSTQSITGYGFSPDLVWTKQRNSAGFHALFDPIRDVHNALRTDSTGATYTDNGLLTAFNSDGFSIGSAGDINGNNNTYVGWAWDAGSSTVSNTDGSITSSVRASATSGFSIVSWSGSGANATIGHGLNAAPEFIILKDRDYVSSWYIYHKEVGNNKYLSFDDGGSYTNPNAWNSTDPTSSVFSVISNINSSGSDIIAYCISPVAGFSAVGSYTGDGTAEHHIHLGFRPAWVLLKRTDTGAWVLFDSARSPTNEFTNWLRPNENVAEATNNKFDIVSNGFVLRKNDSFSNQDTKTFAYVAFAENPVQANGGLAR